MNEPTFYRQATRRDLEEGQRLGRDYIVRKWVVPVEPPDDVPADAKLAWVWMSPAGLDWREVTDE